MTKLVSARTNSLLVGGIALVLLIGAIITWDSFNAARSARSWTEHSYEVLGRLKDLDIGVRDADIGQRGYLMTGQDSFLAPYRAALDRVGFIQGDLQRLTADNPVQQARLRALSPLLQQCLEALAEGVQLRRDSGLDAALRATRTGATERVMTEIERELAVMSADENTLLTQRLSALESRTDRLHLFVFGCLALAIIGLGAAAWRLNRASAASARLQREQWMAAARLRDSLASLSQGVGVFGPDRTLVYSNECFEVLLDIPGCRFEKGAPYASFVHASAGEDGALLEREDQILHGPASGTAITYECTRRDGTVLELRRTATSDGGFVLTISDMTKRAQAEAVLRESQKMQAIGQLTGGIAHDFNNLLTIVLGNLDTMRAKSKGDDAQLVRIERAIWAAQRGALLTNQLLAFARKQPLSPTAIDLAATMPDLVPLLRRTLGEHIEVRYVETAGLWPAMADPAQLESAVLNLALNARDAMPAGGRLTIELANTVLDEHYAEQHAEVTAGDYTMVAVSDTGTGMTPDVLARAFEPFFTTKHGTRGSGLGLPMVFGFVKQSGGHIKIYSELGEGTTVRIYLPRALTATAFDRRGRPPIELPRGSATILVVEDEPGVREIAVAILQDLGYRVFEAADGTQGLRVFGEHSAEIDLLLTDVVLPGRVRGRELADRVMAFKPEVKVLFMSGYTENSIVHHGRLDDGVRFLAKPFKREQLAQKVAEALRPAEVPPRQAEAEKTFRQTGAENFGRQPDTEKTGRQPDAEVVGGEPDAENFGHQSDAENIVELKPRREG
jgi:signal transduction histidine kinase/CheY-like chemotaxis protein